MTGASPPGRLQSLDALRGFDMVWIAGGDAVVEALRNLTEAPPLAALGRQLEHVAWRGFHVEDLIFPLFVFLSGVSLPWSLAAATARGGQSAAVRRLIRRGVVLYLIGVIYYGGFSSRWPDIRLLGVLQRIALCSTAAGLLALWLPPRRLAAVAALILLSYWGGLAAWDRSHDVHPAYAEGENLTNHLDALWLGGKKYDGDHDPEGLLSTLPAIVSCLLGYFAGRRLRDRPAGAAAAVRLAGWGLLALAAGWIWGLEFPVIKKLWTSSFVLVAGGWSLLLLAAFHWLIDIRGWERWARPFAWMGANSLGVYLLPSVVDLGSLAARFTGGDVARALGPLAALVSSLAQVGLLVLFARFLYRRAIFLRV